jgi:hypothetical protein
MRFRSFDLHWPVAMHIRDVAPEEAEQAMRKMGSREAR